jgi:threonine dehydrogenase-like Zn-dependent dehydrogenase
VPSPKLEQPTDAIVALTTSAICGTDLHLVRGTLTGMKPGTILGHEGVGVVEEVGRDVRNLKAGDRVVILTNSREFEQAIDAYRAFDQRRPGWTKVELRVAA